MAKSKKVYVAYHRSTMQIFQLMDELMNTDWGEGEHDNIKEKVEEIKSDFRTPWALYFDSMSTAARFFNVPIGTVKSSVHRGAGMKNGYTVVKQDVMFNHDENRGKHLNIRNKKADSM